MTNVKTTNNEDTTDKMATVSMIKPYGLSNIDDDMEYSTVGQS